MNAIHECYGLGKLEEFVNDETPALTAEALLGAVWKSNLRRVRPESPRRPLRHRRDACSMAWRMPVPPRSTEPAGPRRRREMTL